MAKCRVNVKVLMVFRDVIEKKDVARAREDMDFSILLKHIGKAKVAAKEEFAKRYGPDLGVLTANYQDRETILLYCCPKANMPQSRLGMDTRSLVRPLKPAPR